MIALAASVLLASVLGSAHCAGMCGGFVAFYSAQDATRAQRGWAHAAYNGGRLVSYVMLGVFAGLVGHGLDRVGATAGLERVAAIVAGSLMVIWGGSVLLHAAAGRAQRLPETPAFLRRHFAGAMRAVHAQPPAVRALTLGLVTTLMPCGWLWAFVATAAGTGSLVRGAVVMSAFWLGTVPVMAGLGLLAQQAMGPLRRRLPLVTAAMLVVLGFFTLAGKFQAMAAPHTAAAACGVHGGVAHVGR